MKHYTFLLLTLLTAVAACNSKTENQAKIQPTDSMAALPMPLAYKGVTSIGSNDNLIKVMNWNKWLGSGQMDSAFALLADSVTVNLSSGETFNTTADSVKSVIRSYFKNLTVNIRYIAALPVNVKVSDANTDEWVLSWTDETYTMKDGKKEHNIIHEDYYLLNGRIREINQYSRKVPDAAKQ